MSTDWVLPRTLVLLFLLQSFPPCLQGSSTFPTSAFLLTLFFMSSTPGPIPLCRSYLLSPLGTTCPSQENLLFMGFHQVGKTLVPLKYGERQAALKKNEPTPREKKRGVRKVILGTFSRQAPAVLKLAHTVPLLSISFPWSLVSEFFFGVELINLRFCQNKFEWWFCHLHPN